MAETVEIHGVVGSMIAFGGDDPETNISRIMVVADQDPANEAWSGPQAQAYLEVFLRDPLVQGVQLGTRYKVTFEPLP